MSVSGPQLEILVRRSRRPGTRPPLLCIHGAYTGAWCWDRYLLPYFAERGYEAHAVSLRGHGASAAAAPFDAVSLDDYAADVQQAAARFDRPPVLIGHSMGAVVAQRVARRCAAVAMVLLAPVPPQGMVASVFALAARDPALFLALGTLQAGARRAAPGLKRVRDYLFSTSVTERDALTYLFRMQRESQRALADLAWPQHAWIKTSVGIPVLILGAEDDAFFPTCMIEAAAAFHGVAPRFVSRTAHFMMLEPRWREVAGCIVDWLERRRASWRSE